MIKEKMGKLNEVKTQVNNIFTPLFLNNEEIPIHIKIWTIVLSTAISVALVYISCNFIGTLAFSFFLFPILIVPSVTSRTITPIIGLLFLFASIRITIVGGCYSPTILVFLIAIFSLYTILGYIVATAVYYLIKYHNYAEEVDRRNGFLIKNLKVISKKVPTKIKSICYKCSVIELQDGKLVTTEDYFQNHTDMKFSHKICDKCSERVKKENE